MAELKGKDVNEQETEAITQTGKSPHHHKETHGRSDDIDKNIQVDEVKGPNVFERVKEEVEALVEQFILRKNPKIMIHLRSERLVEPQSLEGLRNSSQCD